MGLTGLRFIVALFLFAWSLWALLPVPVGWLWKPSVAAVEGGHFLFLLVVLVAAPGVDKDGKGQLVAIVCALAGLLFLTPSARAFWNQANVDRALDTHFPAVEGQLLNQRRPFMPVRLIRWSTRETEVERRTFPGADGQPLDVVLYGTGVRASGTETKRPLVVAIHGGSWNSGDPDQLPDLYHWLAERGYAVAAISYRLAPQNTWPAAADDVEAAIKWVRGEAKTLMIDRKKIVLYGRSAGGHLALQAAYTVKPPVAGVVGLYAPSDLEWSWNHPTNRRVLDTPGTLSAFLGGSLQDLPNVYRVASPLAHVNAKSPPTLLAHGGRDELVFAEQSRRLAVSLDHHQVPHALVELPWATHAMEANPYGPSGQALMFSLERFLGTVAPVPSP